jgi:hypothetical protein
MTYAARVNAAPMLVAMPQESGMFALKGLAFATALIACGSTSVQASSIGSVRLDAGSTGLTVVAREQDVRQSFTDALDELKLKSGLTWGQLALLFKVSRRTVHSWANGGAVRLANVARVNELLDHVRQLDSLPAFKIRERLLGLLASPSNGQTLSSNEPPILASDNTPFVHQLELRAAKTKVKRG